MENTQEKKYWTKRYQEERTGWDVGCPTTPLKEYVDQLKNKEIRVLIPGAGNAYEAEYLTQKGFKHVFVMDISEIPLTEFKKRNPNFPKNQLINEDFFKHKGEYDLIIEQTFFCSFIPTSENRMNYVKKMASLLKDKGKLVGVWFDIPLTGDMEKRPFGGDKESYLDHLNHFFDAHVFESCYNSIAPRKGNELFGIFVKK